MLILFLCMLTGVFGMCLGSLALFAIGEIPDDIMHRVLSFAGGAMVSIVCIELLPEAFDQGGATITLVGLAMGVGLILAVDFIAHKLMEGIGAEKRYPHGHVAPGRPGRKPSSRGRDGDESFFRSGVMLLISIGLHNFPEGMAIGSGSAHDIKMGVMMAVTITLHNLPAGMAVTAPLLAGGVSKGKAILFAALSGMPTMLGGAAGLLIGSAAHTALAAALACAGGTMLYVVFGEIIPQSAKAAGMRVTLPMVLLGAAIGFTANALFS